ncbi:hypothetical protein ACWEO4_32020 [Streptomyces sp. NPDC004393]|uniref:hypothetical protein n=1 Tax=Streptomyces sp. NPDC004533 TaxID=3154278 RepID=UPI0033A582A4
MQRVMLAAVTAVLAVGLFGAVTPPTAAHRIPGAPVTKPGQLRKCLRDGGSAGSGHAHEEDFQTAADRYDDQGPDQL